MDPIPLVDEQIEDGAKLVARLTGEGFPVTAAAWVKESDGGRPWYLYLVSPVADGDARDGYRRVQTMIRQMPPPFSVDLFDVKLIGAAEPVAGAIAPAAAHVSRGRGTWLRGPRLDELGIDAAYVYGAVNVSRASDAPHEVA
jgi:hypothetical protein